MPGRLRVCRVEDVPDEGMAAFDVDGVSVPVLVVRQDGEVRAMSGMCPHEDVELVDGSLEHGEVICPGHGYCFDIRTGACDPDRSLRLAIYRTRVEEGEVWIDLFSGGGRSSCD